MVSPPLIIVFGRALLGGNAKVAIHRKLMHVLVIGGTLNTSFTSYRGTQKRC